MTLGGSLSFLFSLTVLGFASCFLVLCLFHLAARLSCLFPPRPSPLCSGSRISRLLTAGAHTSVLLATHMWPIRGSVYAKSFLIVLLGSKGHCSPQFLQEILPHPNVLEKNLINFLTFYCI